MANKRIAEDGVNTRFTSERQPDNPGRKPKIFTILKKRYGINLTSNGTFTRGQIIDLLQSLLSVDMRQTNAVNLTINKDMKKMFEQVRSGNNPDIPKSEEVIAQVFVALSQAINKEASNGKSDTIRWIIEYLFGKATQPVEGDFNTTVKHEVEQMSNEEIEEEIKRIEQIRNDQ